VTRLRDINLRKILWPSNRR